MLVMAEAEQEAVPMKTTSSTEGPSGLSRERPLNYSSPRVSSGRTIRRSAAVSHILR